MYIPASNAESRPDVLFDFIDAHPLGALITSTPADGLFATHLPLLVHRTKGERGTLAGHIARANPHHRHVRAAAGSTDALVIFTGPDAYVTPAWYATKQETGRVVPTWNYIAVHVYGTIRLIEDPAELRPHLEALTARHEGARSTPWSIADAPADYIASQLKAIVGIEVAITRVEGRWKMSQNRSTADIDGVIRGLGASADDAERAVGAIVAERNAERAVERTTEHRPPEGA
jgi:transcriptional regulator